MTNKLQTTVFQRLKFFVESQKIKQKELARLFGTTNQAISSMLSKDGYFLKDFQINALTAAYNCNPVWLLTGKGHHLIGEVLPEENDVKVLRKTIEDLQRDLRTEKNKNEGLSLLVDVLKGNSGVIANTSATSEKNFNGVLLKAIKNNAVQGVLEFDEHLQTKLNLLVKPMRKQA